MTYATLDLLIAKHGERMLIELTDRDEPPTGAVVEAVVAQELANTDALIDGYLGARYLLPLTEVPALLVPIAVKIAIYNLHVYSVPEKIAEDYKGAIADLDKISKGVIRLPVAGIEPASSGASGVQTTDRERPFTEDNLRGFI